MAKVYENIIETIGNTPLVKLNKMNKQGGTILAKLEFFNPMANVKDRIAAAMIAAAEIAGKITPQTIIIEPTSGNTGIGLAFICAAKGYKLKLVMPESMSMERRKLLKILGAEIVLTPAAEGMKGAVDEAEKLVEKNENAYMPQQFKNPANPEIHRRTTAKEIMDDTNGCVDFFIAGVGTGGTITGCGEVMKQHNENIKIIAVEPSDSPILSAGTAGAHKIQGIGAGFIPEILNQDVIDEIITVTNEDALETARQLAAKEGILAGISSGANVWAAMQIAQKKENYEKTIVTIICDTGERYITTELFD